MSKRFNRRIADVLGTTRLDPSGHLAETLKGYVQIYNRHIPQKTLGHISPLQAVKSRHQRHP